MSTEDRREKEKQARRVGILAAAQKVFARKGYHLTNVEEIAQEASLAKGTIYLYFKTKAELFLSLMEERTREMFAAVPEIIRAPMPAREKVLRLVQARLEFCDQNKDFFHLFMSAQFDLEPAEKEKMGRRHIEQSREQVKLVEKIVAECGPGLVTGDTSFLASLLLGLIQSTVMRWMLSGGHKEKIEKESEIICQIFFNGIFKK